MNNNTAACCFGMQEEYSPERVSVALPHAFLLQWLVIILAGICFGVLAPQVAEAAQDRSISFNGTLLQTDVQAFDRAGRTMVPLRFVARAMGAGVKFDYATGITSVEIGTRLIQIPQDSFTYFDNGSSRRLEWPAGIVSGRLMVPTTLIDDVFGTSTYCDGRTGMIIINS